MRLRVKNKIFSVSQIEKCFDTMTGRFNITFTFADFKGYLIMLSVDDFVLDGVFYFMMEYGFYIIDDTDCPYDYILKV